MTIMKKINYKEQILEEVKESLKLVGNNFLLQIFEQNKDDEKELYEKLRNYNLNFLVDLNESNNKENKEEGEEGEKKKKYISRFIYVNGVCLLPQYIGKIILDRQFNLKKAKYEYFILIYPKEIGGEMNEITSISFFDEEERDYNFELLKAKMRLCQIDVC